MYGQSKRREMAKQTAWGGELYICQQCGSPLMNGRTGASCPQGHGRIGSRLPKKIARRNHAILALGLEDVQMDQAGLYHVPGDTKSYKLVKKIHREIVRRPMLPENQVLGLDGTDILVLEALEVSETPFKYSARLPG
jgi:hypothetical protein